MKKYSEMSREELLALKKELDQQFADIKAQGLSPGYVQRETGYGSAGHLHGDDGRP